MQGDQQSLGGVSPAPISDGERLCLPENALKESCGPTKVERRGRHLTHSNLDSGEQARSDVAFNMGMQVCPDSMLGT